jgi:hypothetical protein
MAKRDNVAVSFDELIETGNPYSDAIKGIDALIEKIKVLKTESKELKEVSKTLNNISTKQKTSGDDLKVYETAKLKALDLIKVQENLQKLEKKAFEDRKKAAAELEKQRQKAFQTQLVNEKRQSELIEKTRQKEIEKRLSDEKKATDNLLKNAKQFETKKQNEEKRNLDYLQKQRDKYLQKQLLDEQKAQKQKIDNENKTLSQLEKQRQKYLQKQVADQQKATSELNKQRQKALQSQAKIEAQTREENELLKQNANSIDVLQKQTSVLIKKRRQLDISTVSGAKAFKELTAQIKNNNTKLKELDSQIGNSQRKVGSYREAIMSAVSSVTIFLGSIGAAVAGFVKLNQMTTLTSKQQRILKNNFDVTGDQIDKMTAQIRYLELQSGESFERIQESGNALSKTFGISGIQAFDLLEEAIARGANSTGELFDISREYGDFFKTLGLDTEQYLSIVTTQISEGIYSDKGVDALKEAALTLTRVLTPAAQTALEKIGLSGTELQSQIESGQITMFDAVKQIVSKVNELPKNSKDAGEVITQVFRAAGEDAERFVRSLDKIPLSFSDIKLSLTDAEIATNDLNKEWAEFTVQVSKGDGLIGRFVTKLKEGAAGMLGLLNDFDKNVSLWNSISFSEAWEIMQETKSLQEATNEIYKTAFENQKKRAGLLTGIGSTIGKNLLLQKEELQVENQKAETQKRIYDIEKLRIENISNLRERELANEKKRFEAELEEYKNVAEAKELLTNIYNANIAVINEKFDNEQLSNNFELEKKTLELNKASKTDLLKLELQYNEQKLDLMKQGTFEYQKQLLEIQSIENEILESQKDSYAAQIKTLEENFELEKQFIDIEVKDTEEAAKAKLKAELEFYSAKLEAAKAAFSADKILTDSEKDQLAALQAAIDNLKNSIDTGTDADLSFLDKIFGSGFEEGAAEAISAIKQGTDQFLSAMSEMKQANIDLIDSQIDKSNELLDQLNEQLGEETKLGEQGLANNRQQVLSEIEIEKQKQENLKKQREQAIKERKRIDRLNQAAESAQQVASLVTASAKLLSWGASFPPVGIVLAVGAIAAMLAGFIAIKAKAAKAAEIPKFADGGEIGGHKHSEGGTLIEAERGEFVTNAESYNKSQNLVNDINDGEVSDADYRRWLSLDKNAAPAIVSVNLNELIDINKAQKEYQKETAETLKKFIFVSNNRIIDLKGNERIRV